MPKTYGILFAQGEHTLIVRHSQKKILEAFTMPRTIAEVASILNLKESTVEQAMIAMRAQLRAAGLSFNRVSVYHLEPLPDKNKEQQENEGTSAKSDQSKTNENHDRVFRRPRQSGDSTREKAAKKTSSAKKVRTH